MPLFKEFEIGTHGLAAIWKMEEPEAFFSDGAGIISDIKHEKRRMEFLGGRFLLKLLQKDFPLHNIRKDEHDKPRIDNNDLYFSISHSWPYVAAVVDTHNEAGIDIQTWHPNILRIQHKFLSPTEQLLFPNEQLVTLAWCAKEAAYKWNGRRGVDFIEHLPIIHFDDQAVNKNITINLQSIQGSKKVFTENSITTDFACSYITKCE